MSKLADRKLAAKLKQIDGARNVGRHPVRPTAVNGVRTDLAWRRDEPSHRDDKASDLLEALQWINARASQRKRGERLWTELDEATTREVLARSWGFGELQGLALYTMPAWFSLLNLPTRRGAGYERFLGFVVQAYRAGALGLVIEYEEAMALCGVASKTTWRKWTRELEALQMIRIVQTWRVDPTSKRLGYWRLHYRIGPALEAIGGVALCEKAMPTSASERFARVQAIGLRKRAREFRCARKGVYWQASRAGLRVTDEASRRPSKRWPSTSTSSSTSSSPSSADLEHVRAEEAAIATAIAELAELEQLDAPLEDAPPSTQSEPPAAGRSSPSSAARATTAAAAPASSTTSAELAGVGRGADDHGAGPVALRSPVFDPHSAPDESGAITRAPGAVARGRSQRSPTARCAPSATPRPTPASSADVVDDAGAAAAVVARAAELVDERPTEPTRATAGSDGLRDAGQRPDGPSLLEQWCRDHAPARRAARAAPELATTPKPARPGGARADALRELERATRAAAGARPKCTACDGVGGHWPKLHTRKQSDPGRAWDPTRSIDYGEPTICERCNGSGEEPSSS